MSSKNPFEIRLETLKMAKEMLDQQMNMQENFAYQVLDQFKDQGKDIAEFYATYTPKMYQPAEIVKKADELYQFISNSTMSVVKGGKDKKDAA
jgi:hypothetical protein